MVKYIGKIQRFKVCTEWNHKQVNVMKISINSENILPVRKNAPKIDNKKNKTVSKYDRIISLTIITINRKKLQTLYIIFYFKFYIILKVYPVEIIC